MAVHSNEACNTTKGGAFARRVLSSAMAGALAIGLMPNVTPQAYATETPALLAVDGSVSFTEGSVVAATDKSGHPLTSVTNVSFEYNGTAQYVIPTVVAPKGSTTTVDITDATNYRVTYHRGVDGSGGSFDPIEDAATLSQVGDYSVRIEAIGGDYRGGVIVFPYRITPLALENVSVYEVQEDETDTSDSHFTYDGAAKALGSLEGNIGLMMNDERLNPDDFEASFYYVDRAETTDSPVYAGDYQITLVGKQGTGFSGSQATTQLTIDPLDLASAMFTVEPVMPPADHPIYDPFIKAINGSTTLADTITKLNPQLSYTLAKSSNGDTEAVNPGTYTFDVTPKQQESASSFVGTGSLELDIVEDTNVDFTYAGGAWPTQTIEVDHSDPNKPDFDLDQIKVTPAADPLNDLPLEIEVYDEKNNLVDNTSVTRPGSWKVIVSVDVMATDYQYGGIREINLNVTDGYINPETDIYVTQDEAPGSINGVSFDYDGTNVLDRIGIQILNVNEGALKEGSDYHVAYYRNHGSDRIVLGEEVTEAVNVGSYVIMLTSGNYTIEGGSVKIRVDINAVTPSAIRIVGTKTLGSETGLAYTGQPIVPSFEYTTDNAQDFEGGLSSIDITWKELPAEAYNLTIRETVAGSTEGEVLPGDKVVESITEVGTYALSLTKNNNPDNALIANNYNIATEPLNESGQGNPLIWDGDKENPELNNLVTVINTYVFADVPIDKWYAESIFQASNNGYINGYDGGQLFGPEQDITRADATVIIFNMAGGTMDGSGTSTNISYASRFSDVDLNAYFAEAIGWAARNNIVHGYTDGTFKPWQPITREEFAALITNYAGITNNDTTVTNPEEILAKFPDGSQVSSWFAEVVAWAADNRIMGNAGYLAPQASITRAEVAAMAVNFQPDPLPTS